MNWLLVGLAVLWVVLHPATVRRPILVLAQGLPGWRGLLAPVQLADK